jgi:hypothetical protein
MAFQATVIRTIIASPGDVPALRNIAREVLLEWNNVHSTERGLVLMPVGWETHSSPELGSSPQELINERVLVDCDLLIGIFWTRLGTPTDRAASGSAEEIQRHVGQGKPAMLYFSDEPIPPSKVDPSQYEALKVFKKWCSPQGLIEVFSRPEEFRSKLRNHIQIAIQRNDYLRSCLVGHASLSPGVAAIAPPHFPDLVIPTLCSEARKILLSATLSGDGLIYVVGSSFGRIIQVGKTRFGLATDRRDLARWSDGLEQLLRYELVNCTKSDGSTGGTFQVKEQGYRMADMFGKVATDE